MDFNFKKFQFMESGENIDSLYTLFSDLLDRKLHEMNRPSVQITDVDGQDDIQDDYMAEVVSFIFSTKICKNFLKILTF